MSAELESVFQEALQTRSVPDGFTLTWSSAHALWGGGRTISIEGGVLRLVAHARRGAGQEDCAAERPLSAEQLLSVIEALVAHRIWDVPGPERSGVPDETSVSLKVHAAGVSASAWRWERDHPRFPPGHEPESQPVDHGPGGPVQFPMGPMELSMSPVFRLLPQLPPPPTDPTSEPRQLAGTDRIREIAGQVRLTEILGHPACRAHPPPPQADLSDLEVDLTVGPVPGIDF